MKKIRINPRGHLSKTGSMILVALLSMTLAVLALVAITQSSSRSRGWSQVSPARALGANGSDQATGGMAQGSGIPTSTDLADFLVSATFNAPQNDSGQYVVKPGESYDFRLTFQERYGSSGVLQFPDTATMTYDIPAGLELANGHEGTFVITIRDGSETFPVAGNTYVISGDKLRVDFNTADPNFGKLTATANVRFTLEFEGRLVAEASKLLFSDGIEKSLTVDTTNSVTASKSAQFDKENNRVNYAVTVHSIGRSADVHVKDAMTGAGLTLDTASISVTSSTGRPVSLTGGPQGNGFEYVIPSMSDNEFITFTYSANVDPLAVPSINGRHMTVGENAVEAWSTGDPTPDRREVQTTIDYTPTIEKSDGLVVSEDGSTKTVSWVIEANQGPKVSMAGTAITDTIGSTSQEIMRYSGDGLTVVVKDAGGNTIRTDLVPWDQLESKTDSSWTYIVPPADANAAYSYTIHYTTDVDMTGRVSATTVDNGVTTSGGKSSSGSGQVLPAGGEVLVHKAVSNVTMPNGESNGEVTWNISFNVPADGLTTAEVLDTYPRVWDADGTLYRDKAKQGSVVVSGLVDGEAYDVTYSVAAAVISFYKDATKTQPGLQAAGTRTVTIEIKTEFDGDWLEASRHYREEGRGHLVTHMNTAQLTANGDIKLASAYTTLTLPEIAKTGGLVGTRIVNGVELPIYRYEAVVTGATSDDIEIEDEFDTDLLTYYEGDYPDASHVYGGTVHWQGNGDFKFNRLDTVDGMVISTNSACLPHDGTGGLYPGYRFVYYLTVKDAAAMNTIKERAAASDDGTYAIGNLARFMGGSNSVDVTYKYDGLKKEILTSDSELKKTDEDIWADFRITLNGGGLLLNGGEDLIMTDTVSNLSVDVTSIEANPPAGVSWDMRGNTVTYVIPDGIPIVITYRARVVMSSVGREGDTQRIDFSNRAEMKCYNEEISKTAEYTNSGGYGSGSISSINILKYRAGDMTQTLAGAVFQLQDANGTPIRDKDGNLVEFTTGADGKIEIKGNMDQLGWVIEEDVQYKIEERLAPSGFSLMRNKYSFTVSSDGTTDYGRYIYYSGDTMTVKDYPGTDVRVHKVWGDGNGNHASDEVTVRLQQSIGGGEWSDTIRHEDDDGAWVDEANMDVVLGVSNGWEGLFRGLSLAVPTNLDNVDGGTDAEATYRVVEVAVNGEPLTEVVLGTGGQAEGSGTYVYTVTNEVVSTGEFEVAKTVDSEVAADHDTEFAFTVTLTGEGGATDTTISGTYGDMTFDAGVATFTLTDGDSKVATGLPQGTGYTVTETPTDGFITTIGEDITNEVSGTISDTRAVAAFTNHRETPQTGELEVAKTVDSDIATDRDTEFAFTVTLTGEGGATDTSITGDYGEMSFVSGVATFTLTHGDSKVATDLPQDIGYTVTETPADGFTTTIGEDVTSTVNGTISDTRAVVAFTNHREQPETGELEVAKTVDSEVAADHDTEFAFTVTLTGEGGATDTSITGDYGEMSFVSGVATFTLADGESKVATDLPQGIGYVVAEEPADGFTTEVAGTASGTISDTRAVVAFTNHREQPETGELEVAKTVESDAAADHGIEFSFTVTLTGEGNATDTTISGTYGDMTFDSGVATFTLADGGRKVATDLPQGIGYVVAEAPADGFTTEVTGEVRGSISDTRAVVSFTNTRETGGLTVEKTVVSHTASDKEAAYDFTVTLDDATINGQYGEMTFVDGEAHFSLTDKRIKDDDGESMGTKTAEGLPVGIGYTVTEATEGFTVTSTGETGTIGIVPAPEGAPADADPTYPTASFTNTRDEGEITLSKVVTGITGTNADTEYTFAVVLKDINGNDAAFVDDEHDGVTFERGRALVTLAGGETKTITGLPQGLDYSVTEVTLDSDGAIVSNPPAGFTASYANQAGRIGTDGASVTVTNTYSASGEMPLAAVKRLAGRPFAVGDEWEFTIVPSAGAPLPKDAQGQDVTRVTIAPTEGNEVPVNFGTVSYALADLGGRTSATFSYTIVETTGKDEAGHDKVSDVANDSAKIVTVRVTDNGDGTLGIKRLVNGLEVADGTPVTFTNIYQARETLQATKNLEGRGWLDDAGDGSPERYGFEIISTGDSLAKLEVSPIESVAYTDDEAEPATFGDLVFTTADAGKAYTYTIREIVPDDATNPSGVAFGDVDLEDGRSGPWVKDGVTYSDRQFQVRYEITADGNGNLQIDKTCSPAATSGVISFTNTYEASEVSQDIVAAKSLRGGQLSAGDFEFRLHDVTRNKDYTARNGYVTDDGSLVEGSDAGAIVFDAIDAFESVGDYSFTLSEVVPEDATVQADGTFVLDGVTYDPTTYEVTISVTDDLHGHLVASKPTYRVAGSDATGSTAVPIFSNAYFGAQANVAFGKSFYGHDGNAEFGFTLTAAEGDDFVPRQHGAGDAITNDAAAYGADNLLVDDGSAFQLSLTNGEFDESGHATVSVPTITYHAPGTYRYVITEDASESGVPGDASEILVAVTVHEDARVDEPVYAIRANGETTLVGAQDATFYNNDLVTVDFRARALGVRVQAEAIRTARYMPQIRKILSNGYLKGGEFSFVLCGTDGTTLSTATNDADGAVAFGTLSYGDADVDKTYTYVISEEAGTDPTIRYDTHVITLTVTISEAEDGSLVVSDAYYVSDGEGGLVETDDPTIINSYESIVIHAVKRTREFNEDGTINNAAEGLPGAHYGLWMVNPGGEDIYMGLGRDRVEKDGAKLESDANGNLYYDIPPLQGVAYYFLEEAPAPEGHLVDPYPTDYFTLVRDDDGFRLVYENDGPDANGKVLTDYVPSLGL